MSPDEASVQMSSDDMPEVDGGSSSVCAPMAWESRYGFQVSTHPVLFAKERTNGASVYFPQQTVNYGEWNLQVEGRLRRGTELLSPGAQGYAYAYGMKPRSERITLRNYGLPVTASVFADSTFGDQMGDVTDASSATTVCSGSSVVRGATTRIYGAGFDVIAGMGQRGSLVGVPFPGFESFWWITGLGGASRRFERLRRACTPIRPAKCRRTDTSGSLPQRALARRGRAKIWRRWRFRWGMGSIR